ncbi:SnoaL-like protein [Rhizobium sp. PP-CC-2G-626]|nr:SnoaL-like protein [Rhizobium sp. PP-CC-2G-626]
MDNQTLERSWNSYLAAYGSITDDERERLLEQSVSDDLVFTNPGGQGEHRAGLVAHIQNFQRTMPGTYFSTEKTFVHHGELLAIWAMHKPDGTKVATGYNFVRTGDDGRFVYMAGFF